MAGTDEDEELLRSGSPLAGRAGRIALAVFAAVVLVLAGVRLWSHGGSAAEHDRPVAAPKPTATDRPAGQAWPTVAAACGPVQRPFLSTTPIRERTGLRVLLGGDRLVSVDVDSGAVATVTGPAVPAGRSVIQLQGRSPAYAITASCDANGQRALVRVQDGQAQPVPVTGALLSVLADSSRAWALTSQPNPPHRSELVSLTGPARLPLDLMFFPAALIGSVVVGDEIPGNGASWGEPPLVLARNASTGGLRGVLGLGWLMTVANDTVVWRDACYDETVTICHLRYAALSQPRRVRSIALPAGRFPTAKATASPNGKLVAFPLLRTAADTSYPDGSPGEVAVADLTTGRVAVLPGVQLPSSPPSGLAFSADGRWLIIAVNAGRQVRLLAWRPGLARPQETAAVPVSAGGAPPVLVTSGG